MSGNTEKDRNDQFDPGTYPASQILEIELPKPILESSTSIE
ncbi:hypothetical protein [Methanococcoides orientis]|nr:hypothetical protein [Methanococcoides orientis]